ncbi:hypothetical protein NP233_g4854 [Leucocoprinus birnbaumii]|uniref:SYO1-like TPR repeats domain-containing protein n=1 Tax=Leucocoprinus birnbaumii TaxID=56174 RepID=A0AAD5VVB6_9AGAR|nr:hypothetical protein NP233_g4854 [Leucocoprinus birnbaumii]
MGKSQKKKSMRRHNPVRVPDTHLPKGLASAEQSSSKKAAILPILQKMESADATERKWACVAVANLIQNDPSTRRLLQGKNVVGALITRLTDSEEEVVAEAVGALRNLCIDGGYDICAEMYNKNILTPLATFVPKVSTVLTQYLSDPKSAPENAQNLVYELADNLITILWCLSETSNKALTAINGIHLVPFLMSFLAARDKLPLGPVVSAAQCLYVLTDDNPPAISDVKSDASYLSCLLEIARPGNIANADANQKDPRIVTLSVLGAGILRNVSPLPPPTVVSLVDLDKDVILPLLQPTISSISISEITAVAQELITAQTTEPQIEKLSLKHVPKSDHKSSAEMELGKIETRLRTVQLALEILTGVCATLPDPEFGPDAEDEMDEPEDEDLENGDEDADDMNMEADGISSDQPSVPSFITSLVNPLVALIQPSSLSFPPLAAPSPHPPTTSALSAVHVTALECLNNVFLSLASSRKPEIAADVVSGMKIWNDVWSALAAVGTQTGLGQERRQDMWEKAVGVLWGIGNVWKGSLEPNEEHISLLIQFCNASSDSKVKTQCIGTLECLAQHPNSIQANRVISEYFISLLPSGSESSSVDTEPLIQAVSALIDIYSDENMPYDVNFRQGQYLHRLVSSVEGVRKAVKNVDRRKEGGRELRLRADEVRENLVAFIKYPRQPFTSVYRTYGPVRPLQLPLTMKDAKSGQPVTLYISYPRFEEDSKQVVTAPDANPPLPIFSQAIKANGFVYVSGNIGSKGFTLVEGGVQAETRAAMENIIKVLKASGTTLDNVVKVNIYLTNFDRDFVLMNEVYLELEKRDVLTCPMGLKSRGKVLGINQSTDTKTRLFFITNSRRKIVMSNVIKQKVFSPEANPPLPVYSQAIISKGFVFVCGNVGHDRNLKLYEGGIKVETRAALENMKKILTAAGTSLENVVKVNIFMANLDEFQAMNEIYAEYFNMDAKPARTCVQVAVLPLKAAVEIECTAVLPV